MIEQIIKNVLNAMTSRLDPEQLEHLSNVLYMNFHGKELREECTELVNTEEDGDEQEEKNLGTLCEGSPECDDLFG